MKKARQNPGKCDICGADLIPQIQYSVETRLHGLLYVCSRCYDWCLKHPNVMDAA